MEFLSRMLSLVGKFMIGRWMSLLFFFRNYSLSQFEWGDKINCGGFPPKKEFLRSKITSEPCLLWNEAVSLGRVCGGLSLPQGLHFLCGWQH